MKTLPTEDQIQIDKSLKPMYEGIEAYKDDAQEIVDRVARVENSTLLDEIQLASYRIIELAYQKYHRVAAENFWEDEILDGSEYHLRRRLNNLNNIPKISDYIKELEDIKKILLNWEDALKGHSNYKSDWVKELQNELYKIKDNPNQKYNKINLIVIFDVSGSNLSNVYNGISMGDALKAYIFPILKKMDGELWEVDSGVPNKITKLQDITNNIRFQTSGGGGTNFDDAFGMVWEKSLKEPETEFKTIIFTDADTTWDTELMPSNLLIVTNNEKHLPKLKPTQRAIIISEEYAKGGTMIGDVKKSIDTQSYFNWLWSWEKIQLKEDIGYGSDGSEWKLSFNVLPDGKYEVKMENMLEKGEMAKIFIKKSFGGSMKTGGSMATGGELKTGDWTTINGRKTKILDAYTNKSFGDKVVYKVKVPQYVGIKNSPLTTAIYIKDELTGELRRINRGDYVDTNSGTMARGGKFTGMKDLHIDMSVVVDKMSDKEVADYLKKSLKEFNENKYFNRELAVDKMTNDKYQDYLVEQDMRMDERRGLATGGILEYAIWGGSPIQVVKKGRTRAEVKDVKGNSYNPLISALKFTPNAKSEFLKSEKEMLDLYGGAQFMAKGGSIDTSSLEGKPLSEIAQIIRKDWKNMYFGAVPYVDAMSSLSNITDDYYQDSGRSIVSYFLGNAQSWRGDTAKMVKAYLNKLLKNSYAKGGILNQTLSFKELFTK